jgi:hypothetical protein
LIIFRFHTTFPEKDKKHPSQRPIRLIMGVSSNEDFNVSIFGNAAYASESQTVEPQTKTKKIDNNEQGYSLFIKEKIGKDTKKKITILPDENNLDQYLKTNNENIDKIISKGMFIKTSLFIKEEVMKKWLLLVGVLVVLIVFLLFSDVVLIDKYDSSLTDMNETIMEAGYGILENGQVTYEVLTNDPETIEKILQEIDNTWVSHLYSVDETSDNWIEIYLNTDVNNVEYGHSFVFRYYPEYDTFVLFNHRGGDLGHVSAKTMPIIKKLLKQKKLI